MKPNGMVTKKGRAVREYINSKGTVYVALCDVIPLSEDHNQTTSLAYALASSADAHLVKPDGDTHRKWVARKRDTFAYLMLQDDQPAPVFTDASEEKLEIFMKKHEAVQANLQERIDKHNRDITSLEARLEANRKGRDFLQNLLNDLS